MATLSEPLAVNVYILTPPAADTKHPYYLAQYLCPITGKRITRSTKIPKPTKKGGGARSLAAAKKFAAAWEADLRSGAYAPPPKASWPMFRDRYEVQHVAALADKTATKISGVLNSFERFANPRNLRDVTTARITAWTADMQAKGRASSTVAGSLAHLRAALAWAVDNGMLHAVPKINRPHRAKHGQRSVKMKGRPLTAEDFARFLASVEAGLLSAHQTRREDQPVKKRRTGAGIAKLRAAERQAIDDGAPDWRRLIEGLWLSGLRLGEALDLRWDSDESLSVDFSRKRPMLRIPGDCEKGNTDRLLPMTPDFAAFLLQTPEAERTGLVFPIMPRRIIPGRIGTDRVSRLLSSIGKAAGVLVSRTGKAEKWASAHDFRRSFGERWAMRVMPPVLMQLMRHRNIQTTMSYYVGRNAESAAEALWERWEGPESTARYTPAHNNGSQVVMG